MNEIQNLNSTFSISFFFKNAWSDPLKCFHNSLIGYDLGNAGRGPSLVTFPTGTSVKRSLLHQGSANVAHRPSMVCELFLYGLGVWGKHCESKLGCPLHPVPHSAPSTCWVPSLGVEDAVTSLLVHHPREDSWDLQEERVWVSLGKEK